LCGTVMPADWEATPRRSEIEAGRDLPSAWDWRDHNGCTPIRNQGGCGSCWAFSAVGAVECSILINEGWNLNLSEQWLVSCTEAGDCGGGWHNGALAYLTCRPNAYDSCGDCGPVPENEFPYVGWNAPCYCPYSHPYQVDSFGFAGNKEDIAQIKEAIHFYGPVSVTVRADGAFQGYDGGIFNACSSGSINHAVVLVGWDDSLGSEGCWILRNSWGSWWGDGGYMYIEYGCSSVGNSAYFIKYRYDCNHNQIPDADEIAQGLVEDCNGNGVPDECDITSGRSPDCNGNEIPDECESGRSTRLYVDQSANGDNTGVDWANALLSPEAAYCYAETDAGINEVWVARGTYTPCDDGNIQRSRTIRLINGVSYHGGFAGYETALEQRDLSNPDNRTILSGDLLGNDLPGFVNNEDNSYHVLLAEEVDETAVLDSFTIIGGNADGDDNDSLGGGLYNHMGAPTIMNCVFIGNYASNYGGAMCNHWQHYGVGESHPTLINCVFMGNSSWHFGGAVANNGSYLGSVTPTFVNCTIVGNVSSGISGGGIGSSNSGTPVLHNCVVWGNSVMPESLFLGQIYGPASIDYSCVEGWEPGLGGEANMAANPNMIDPDGVDDALGTPDDDPRLNFGSPCIDAGDNAAFPDGIWFDAVGAPRFHDDPGTEDTGNLNGGGGVIDMGACEFQGITCFADITGDGQINLADLGQLLSNYGMTSGASYSNGDLNGDGAVELSDLGELLARYGDSCP